MLQVSCEGGYLLLVVRLSRSCPLASRALVGCKGCISERFKLADEALQSRSLDVGAHEQPIAVVASPTHKRVAFYECQFSRAMLFLPICSWADVSIFCDFQ